MNKYRFNIAWSEEDKGYIVTCPDFPGLSAFGESPEQALMEAQVALKLFIKTYEEKGLSLPEPETIQNYSGQLRLRLPKSLHAQAVKMAAADGVSLNQFICDALRAKVTEENIEQSVVRAIQKEFASQPTTQLYKYYVTSERSPQIQETTANKLSMTTTEQSIQQFLKIRKGN